MDVCFIKVIKVSLTVRYSIATVRVAEVFEKYSHDGDLSSYVQTATQEQLRLAADNKLKTVESEQKQKIASAEDETNALKAKAEKWNGALPVNMYGSAPIPFLNVHDK